MLSEIDIDLLIFKLFFGEEPSQQKVQRIHKLHNDLILLIKLELRKQFMKYILAYPDHIFWLNMSTFLQTTNRKQKYIFPCFSHLYLINVCSSEIEEASHIFKNINKHQSKVL